MKRIKLLILIMFATFLVGCGVSSDITEDYVVNSGGAYRGQTKLEQNLSDELEKFEDNPVEDNSVNLDDSNETQEAIEDENIQKTITPKILSVYNVSIETTYLDNDIKFLENKTHELNGYIKSLDVKESIDKKYKRAANISIRIPKNETMKLIQYIKERYLIIHEFSEAVEVSETYFDLELNINNLEMQENHLLNMYENTTNIEEMLKVNERIMEISKEKAKLTSDYLSLQERLEYSIIEISMHEDANVYNGLSAIDKIRNNFSKISKSIGNFMENALVFIISFSPIIIILIIPIIMCKKAKDNLSDKLQEENQFDEIIAEEINEDIIEETIEESSGKESED